MPATKLLTGPNFVPDENQILICVALSLEERALAHRFDLRASGPILRLADIVAQATLGHCRTVVSFGFAGALCPGLGAGDVIVASAVAAGDAEFRTDDHWSSRLLAELPGAFYGAVAGVDRALTNETDRTTVAGRTGAIAVDMESHLIAAVASALQRRLVVIRVVVDPCCRCIPRAALGCLSDDGEASVAQLLQLVARRPSDGFDVARLWLDWMLARRALVTCSEVLGNAASRACRE